MNKHRNNNMKKTWKLICTFIVIFFVYYSFFYFPSIPTASIQYEHKTYELKAKDYDYSAFGKSNTNKLTYKSVNELNTHLQSESEITIHSNHQFTYNNSASTIATNIYFYSVDRNEVIPRAETESTVQSISEPGHYIVQYLSEFETGKTASYFVKINVVKNNKI
jgi:amino acid transporter